MLQNIILKKGNIRHYANQKWLTYFQKTGQCFGQCVR